MASLGNLSHKIWHQSVTNVLHRYPFIIPAINSAITSAVSPCCQLKRSYCSNTKLVNKINHRIYPRMYKGIIVNSDGSTIRSRLVKPFHVVQLPLDLNQLSEKERLQRLKKFQDQKEIIYEDILSGEEFDHEAVTKLITKNTRKSKK
ncbi:39S ribosomal protein L55, mitochondrial [Trichoplax sp. H2]|nr:39S ribosomal protein L55, mitochondrial [Trichoplax sp. H2]|eukprot:RDD42279.1 39S ribosomal protein L55, mitochondrial [Trichoplax sp. H2]